MLRPSVVFGPEDDFFNRFAAMARVSPALPLIGGGRMRFQPIYVGDVADAAAHALENPALAGQIFELGGPLSRTKLVSKDGISDIRNNLAAFCVVNAESQEAAARLFLNHPHFTIFPGEGVEIMEVLPIPAG